MGWLFQPACEAFHRHGELWNELNRLRGNHVLLDSTFVGLLVRHFGSRKILLAISDDPKRPCMALVEKYRPGLWRTFQPSQAPLGLIVFGREVDVSVQSQLLLANLPGYALMLSVLQQDSDFSASSGLDKSLLVDRLEYIKTARLKVTGSFGDYWGRRSRNLVHNLSRQRRRLAEQGIRLELVAEREVDQIAHGISEYGRLEGKGWKAAGGTAVTPENRQGRFYRDLLERFCAQKEGVIYRLLMNGKTAAVDLCLERNGMLVVLKTTYDENVTHSSPGLLLHQEIFKTLFAEQHIKAIEFYGRVRDWHTKWTEEIRTMHHLMFYRHRWVHVLQMLTRANGNRESTK